MAIEGTITEFQIPLGYEDKEGVVHRDVVMRKVKNIDITTIQKDEALRKISASGEKLELDTKNPVTAMRINAHVIVLFNLLFSRVVLRLGTIEDPKKDLFMELYQEDMAVLMEKYAELNGVDIEAVKEAALNSPLPSEQ
jgi:hypothetical protein